jgi:hypothetical protein
MDNQVKPTRTGLFEAMMGTVQDTLLLGMLEQRIENKNNNDNNQPKQLLRLKKPRQSLGFIYEEIPMFDVEYAKEFG